MAMLSVCQCRLCPEFCSYYVPSILANGQVHESKVPECHHPRGTTLRSPREFASQRVLRASAGASSRFCEVSAGLCGVCWGPRNFPRVVTYPCGPGNCWTRVMVPPFPTFAHSREQGRKADSLRPNIVSSETRLSPAPPKGEQACNCKQQNGSKFWGAHFCQFVRAFLVCIS